MANYHVRRSIGEHILRSFVLVAALFIMSLGIALSAKASLGVSPISCTPYVLSLALPLSMGGITILMHLSFVAVQAALLKRQFRPVHLLQIPVAFVFGMLTDFSMWLVSPLEPAGYAWSAVICLLSCVILGFGVFMQVKADAVLLAAEGMNLAFVKLFKWEFGAVKTGMDCTLVCIGLACSFSCCTASPASGRNRRGRHSGGHDRPVLQQTRILAGQAAGTRRTARRHAGTPAFRGNGGLRSGCASGHLY
ncbi:MAG: YczE/YyaS/YitT family protein [Akkermansia sp.]